MLDPYIIIILNIKFAKFEFLKILRVILTYTKSLRVKLSQADIMLI
jgi:hypothetical protein